MLLDSGIRLNTGVSDNTFERTFFTMERDDS